MKKTCLAVLVLTMVCGGLFAGTVVKNVNHDAFVVHVDTYNQVMEQQGSGLEVGAWKDGSTVFQERSVFKWNLTGVTVPVTSAVITFPIEWTQLTGSFAGDIKISTFTTANNGAAVATDGGWNGDIPIEPTASKVAFAGSTTGAVTVDVTDWLNAAITNGLSYFCVRLDADYLFVEPVLPALTNGIKLSWLYAAESGYGTTLTLSLAQAQAPVFSQTSPYVSGPTQVSITCPTEGSNIYYTLNGPAPTSSSTPYTGPVTVNNGITLKAIAVANGYADSPVTSKSYVLACDVSAIASINIDGDLSDWSNSTQWSQPYIWWDGIVLTSETRAKFAWNDAQNMLYVAIKTNQANGGHAVLGFSKDFAGASTSGIGSTQLAFDPVSGSNAVTIMNENQYYKDKYQSTDPNNPNELNSWGGGTIDGVMAKYSFNNIDGTYTYEIAIPFWADWRPGEAKVKQSLTPGDVVYLYSVLESALESGAGTNLTYYGNAAFYNGPFDKAVALTLTGPAAIPGDANGDNMVDVGDLGILAANYGQSGKTWEQGDFNNDHAVDVGDLGILAAHYGEGSTQASNFSEDYAKAFGTTVADDTAEETSSSICSGLGLPLIGGLMLACLMMLGGSKLED
jgi:hypothetical protein